MAGNRTLKVSITGDARGLKKATKESEAALQGFSAGFRGASKSAAEWGEDVRRASGVAAAASLYLAKKSADAASDTTESLNKNAVVFGNYADEVNAFADTSAKAYGISRRAALEYTGTLGNLLVSSGLAAETAADFSVSLTQLAADLASFNNTSVEDALEAIRSGLVGESEPLKRFGVNLNEATLKAKALELGLYAGKGALDANAKAQAAYAVIMGQTATAANDFAENSTEIANSQKIVAATADDAAASLGSELQPAYKALVGVVGTAVDALEAMPGPLKAVAVGTVAVGGGAVWMAPKVMEGAAALKALGASSNVAVVGLTKLIPLAAVVGAAYLSLKGEIASSISDSFSQTGADELLADTDKVISRMKKADEATGGWAAGVKRLNDSLFNLGRNTRSPIVEIDRLDDALAALVNSGRGDEAEKQFGDIAAAALASGMTAEEVARQFNDYWDAVDRGPDRAIISIAETIAHVMTMQAQATLAVAAADGQSVSAAKSAHQANRDRLNQVTEQIAKNEGLRSSLRALADSVKAYNDNEREAAGFGPQVAAIRANAAKQAVENAEAIRQAQRAEVDAARGLEAANRGVETAVLARAEAARAVITAERGVVDAERGVQDALRGVVDAHRAVRDAEWGRQDALRGLQTAIRGIEQAEYARGQALRSVEAAERAVVRSEQDSLRSVRDLATARREAAWELTSQALAARGDALSIQSAELALADAQAAAAAGPGEGNTDPRAQQRLALAVSQAQLQLEQANAAAARSTVELSEAQAAGVEGSDAVINALRGVEDGSLSVEDANRALVDANRGVEDANRTVEDAHLGVRDALRGVESADIAVATANRGVGDANRAVEDSNITLADAHRAVDDAVRGVADADQGLKDAHYAVRDAQVAVADAARATATAVQKSSDDQQIALFEANLVMDAAKTKAGELRDKVIADMGQAADAMRPFNYSLATTQALISGILGLTPISVAPAVQAILAGLTPVGAGGGETNFNAGGGVTFRAAGGPVRKGQPYIVGEQRPELFVPDQSGTIIPKVPGAGSSGPVVVQVMLDKKVLASALVSELPRANRALAGAR